MIAPETSARELLVSLVPEERRGRPGAAAEAALEAARKDADQGAMHLLVAVYAALAAGEARHVLRLLDEIAATPDDALQRRVRACRAWAQQVDRNWYPGDVGAELAPDALEGLTTVGEVLPGDAETMFVESCAANGPGSLFSVRTILRNFARQPPPAAGGVLQSALGGLERFKAIAIANGAPRSACWAVVAQADLLRRSGHTAEGQQLLEHARKIYEADSDGIGLAGTYILEGDWWATPGSSPEALGFDLAVQQQPSPLADQQDDRRSADAYRRADILLRFVDAPRAAGAVALRRALLSSRSGLIQEQLAWLATADKAFADAGDAAGCHLVSVHRLAAAVALGDFVALREASPPEWTATVHGPIAEIAAWGSERGSLSFCTGLGRILQRVAERWEGLGDLDRAEIAYLMARPLVSLNGAVPSWTVAMALAQLDARRNVPVRSLVRRLHILASLPPPQMATGKAMEWIQDVYVTMSLGDLPTGMIGVGPITMRTIERGAERLHALLGVAGLASVADALPPLDPKAALEQLRDSYSRLSLDDAIGQAGSGLSEIERVALATAAHGAREQLARAKPLVSMLRAGQAERLGWEAEAELWYQTAREHSASAGSASLWIGVLVLNAWGKHDEARVLFNRIRAERLIDETLLPSLALRARDFMAARKLFQELDARSAGQGMGWVDLLDRAEASLECGEPAAALELGAKGMAEFERTIGRLPRDPDRVAACDDVKAASLYQVAARACLALADDAIERKDEAGRLSSLDRAFSVADRGRSLAIPRLVAEPTAAEAHPEDRLHQWQQAATEQSTAYQRFLAEMALGGGDPVATLANELGHAERRLAEIEADLGADDRESVLEAHRPRSFTLADAQALLPAGSCLLEYQLVGRDLVAWGLTASSIRGRHERLPRRTLDGAVSRLLRACAAGEPSVEASDLARLLLEPFAELLDRQERVVVVPFGPLHAVPFHALPFRGEPLGSTHVLSYLPAASVLLQNPVDRALGTGGALVVGDPAFDPELHPSLRRLAGAALEAQVVARLHGTHDVFCAGDAQEARLRPLLRRRAVLHFAAHGRLDETAPNTSSIVLAGRDQLTVSDLIGLRIDADLAVLSACDTGRGALSLGGDVVGLTRGLLAAGVSRSVVSLWPVDDAAACVTMIAFHERMLGGDAPALALARAQREIRAMSGSALAARYRELGGELEPGRVSTRRKSSEPRGTTHSPRRLAPFPENDLDDAPARIVEESHGSLASIWAPFVLIGC